ATVLAFSGLAALARITRSSLLEVLRAEYVRTARSKGLVERTVVYKHAFRNGLVPVVTVIGIQVGHLFSGAVLTETIFAWPGVGRWAVSGITRGDVPVVMGVALFTCAVYSIVNLIVDLSYLLIDPRLRTE
ncbi:MAG: ABC transporter permease, partial [Armatimonadetes bacterium]|nr:ABC transporter permease [Armatimonadota bacterium]